MSRPVQPPGGAFFDRPGVRERHRLRAAGVSDPVRVMEDPAFDEVLGAVIGLRVLDLGCGDAALGRADRAPRHHLARRPAGHGRAAHALDRRRLLRARCARAAVARRGGDLAPPDGGGPRHGVAASRFALTALRECAPRPERFAGDEAELARRRRIPLFLLLAGVSA